MLLILCDIDGSISDIRTRLAFAGPEPDRTDLRAFDDWLNRLQSEETLIKDEPIEAMQRLVRLLATKSPDEVEIKYLTGRSEKFRQITERWLFLHRFPEADLFMRANDDYRGAGEYKAEKVKELSQRYKNIIAIDDDPMGDTTDHYRAHGVTHLKVLHG